MKRASPATARAADARAGDLQARVETAVAEIGKVLLGKEEQVRLALCCLLAGGHLLMEDRPGMGKTTLSQALARVTGLDYSRIQFTNDLLPADILGVSVYDQRQGRFDFHPGPVFRHLILADEINRTTPKTQSALLEAMEEGQVTIEGETRPLPRPFFVIATQNPATFAGTYPLPESQLDRFLMRLEIGYPDPGAERALLETGDHRGGLATISQCLDTGDIRAAAAALTGVRVSDALLDYVQRLVAYTREPERFTFGLSPRGALSLMRAARAWALMQGRDHVLPDDVQAVLSPVVDHRLRAVDGADHDPAQGDHARGDHGRRLLADVDLF